MKNIAIKRLRLLSLPQGKGLSAKHQLVLLSELAKLGVQITNREALATASESFFLDYEQVMKTIAQMRGGDVDYVPLFLGFPNDVPEDNEYFSKRIIGYLGNSLQIFPDGRKLADGTIVPEWLFDLEQFGADPISQFQDAAMLARAKKKLAKQEEDSHVEAMTFEFVDVEEITERLRVWLQACLYAKSSIKEVLHDDIRTLLNFFGGEWIDFDQVVMKENQALLLSMLWKDKREAEATALAKTPTDLLRLFAALTDSDVSLGKTIKFPKFSRKQRRLVLGVLEESSALAEDLYRYKGLWLQLGRYIHPGEYRKAYPKTAAAFRALCDGSIVTFNAQTEKLMGADYAGPVLAHLQKRPGVLARKLHELLRVFPKNTDAVLRTFSDVASQMTVKNLLVLKSYFASINDYEFRCVINKKGKIKVLPNNAQTGGYCVPLIVDLEAKEIIVTDLYMGSRNFNNSVEGEYPEVCKASREISRFTQSRPTLATLAQLHQQARGGTSVSQEEADISFGITGCTYNASDVETLLSELL